MIAADVIVNWYFLRFFANGKIFETKFYVLCTTNFQKFAI